MSLNIIKAMATKNPCYKKATAMTVKGIVVHSTGANNPNLKRYVDAEEEVGKNTNGNHWNNANMTVCVHAFIGYDKNNKVRIAQILPYNYACWGVGKGSKGSFNYNPTGHIQFEMCEDDHKSESYCKAVYNAAVEYCAYLCKEYNLDPLGKNVIVSHKEAHDLGYGSNHGDPHDWWDKFGYTMDGFRKQVKVKMTENNTSSSTSSSTKKSTSTESSSSLSSVGPTTFQVKIICDELNVRDGAGTKYKINQKVKKGEVFTIVKTLSGWGYLKSGAGWISLGSKYVKVL